jgi:hypothetical protein
VQSFIGDGLQNAKSSWFSGLVFRSNKSNSKKRRKAMKKVITLGLIGLCLIVLAACGRTELAQGKEPAVDADGYRYILNGVASSAAEVTQLSEQGVRLFYFVEGNEPHYTAYVFTNEVDFENHRQQAATLDAQGWCISTRTKTTVYDGTSYSNGADSWDIAKGLNYPNLHLFLQNAPVGGGDGTWGNDISSIKMADCVYTTLYTDTNYSVSGDVFSHKGGNFSTMPAGFDNTVSSIKVGS